jgi:hypothetical protein
LRAFAAPYKKGRLGRHQLPFGRRNITRLRDGHEHEGIASVDHIGRKRYGGGCTPVIQGSLPDPKLTARDKQMMAYPKEANNHDNQTLTQPPSEQPGGRNVMPIAS